jgi:hypothetical protein
MLTSPCLLEGVIHLAIVSRRSISHTIRSEITALRLDAREMPADEAAHMQGVGWTFGDDAHAVERASTALYL